MLQGVLPILVFGGSKSDGTTLTLTGGTNVSMSPPVDYTIELFKTLLERNGIHIDRFNIHRRGYYPKGGGEIQLTIDPLRYPLRPITICNLREPLKRIEGYSYVGGTLFLRSFAEDMVSEATKLLRTSYPNIPINIRTIKEKDVGNNGSGFGIV